MPFEAKALRVQLPCGSVTVIDEDRALELQARNYWRDRFTTRFDGDETNCPRDTGDADCFRGSADIDLQRLTDHICRGTDPLDVRTVVDVRVLPLLRKQLEERLKEIDAAEAAVANHPGGG